MSETNVAIQIKIKKGNACYPGLRSNRFADIASLSLSMTRLLLKAPQAHNVSQLPYFPVIANEWNECGDPDKNQKRNIYYRGLQSNRFADIASLSLAMTL